MPITGSSAVVEPGFDSLYARGVEFGDIVFIADTDPGTHAFSVSCKEITIGLSPHSPGIGKGYISARLLGESGCSPGRQGARRTRRHNSDSEGTGCDGSRGVVSETAEHCLSLAARCDHTRVMERRLAKAPAFRGSTVFGTGSERKMLGKRFNESNDMPSISDGR